VMTKCAGGGDGDPKGACLVCIPDGLQQRHRVCVVMRSENVQSPESASNVACYHTRRMPHS
jgi:hypothetical protein